LAPYWHSSVLYYGNANGYLESSTEAEQQKTFRELSDTIVTFVVETYNLVLERLNGKNQV
jgi:hypothetical protein